MHYIENQLTPTLIQMLSKYAYPTNTNTLAHLHNHIIALGKFTFPHRTVEVYKKDQSKIHQNLKKFKQKYG